MIKLIASDLDGTLLQHSANTVDPKIIEVINQLGEKGIHFIAASGRPYCNLQYIFRNVTVPMSFICENGALYAFHDKVYVPNSHKKEVATLLIRTVREDPETELFYSCEDTIYVEGSEMEFLKSIEGRKGYSVTHVNDLLALDRLPLKLAIYNKQGIERSVEKYKDLFSEYVNVITSGNVWLDFMPYGINKATSLKHITETMGITPEECMAFGDQWNDVEMLSFVGTSYAMTTGAPGVSDYATHTTDSVLKELEKLLASI